MMGASKNLPLHQRFFCIKFWTTYELNIARTNFCSCLSYRFTHDHFFVLISTKPCKKIHYWNTIKRDFFGGSSGWEIFSQPITCIHLSRDTSHYIIPYSSFLLTKIEFKTLPIFKISLSWPNKSNWSLEYKDWTTPETDL